MRITHNTIYSNLIKYIDENYDKLNTINEHISSGKKVNNLSDSPLDAIKIVKLNKKLNAINQYSRNITTAGMWLKTTDTALMQFKELNTQVKTLTTQAATETYTYDQRRSMATQISAIADNIMEIANTDLNGKYIFSGYKVNNPPFETKITVSDNNYSIDAYNYNFDLNLKIRFLDSTHYEFSVDDGKTWIDNNGNGYTINSVNPILGFSINSSTTASAGDTVEFQIEHVYQGDNGKFKIDIDKTQQLQVNKLGSEVFIPNDQKNIFKTLGKIWAGMVTNNRDLITEQIDNLNDIETNILNHDAEIGLKQNILENFKTNFIEDKKEVVTNEISEIQDTDIAEEMTNLAKQQMVYQATLKTAAMITNLTILNFL